MDGQTYEIKLNLNIDDSQLTNAERRIKNMENGRVGGRGGSRTSGVGSYSNIPARQQGYYRLLNQRFGSTRGLSNEGFLGNVNRMYHRSDVFKRAFLGNLTSLPGMLRNLSNFGSVLGSIGKIAGGVVPVLGTLASALSGVAKVFLAYKGITFAIQGGALMLGNKLLNSQELGQAGSSLMQFEMARKGLGGSYRQAYDDAARLAAEYGFSRTGILNSINMLTGLNVGNRTLGRDEATRIATQAGKIAHVGGVPFERVNINLQQLLGQPTPSARDLRELIQAAPIIGKIAQQSMAKKGVAGDIFAYLKDKSALLDVLNSFDKMIESNPYMQARGKASLYKENFLINIVDSNKSVWPKIAEGLGAFYDEAGKIVNQLLPKLGDLLSPENIRNMMAEVTTFFSAIYDIFATIGNGIKGLTNFIPYVGWNGVVGRYAPTYSLDKDNNLIMGTPSKFYTIGSYYGNKRDNAINWSLFADRQAKLLPETPHFEATLRSVYDAQNAGSPTAASSFAPMWSKDLNTATVRNKLLPYDRIKKAFEQEFARNPWAFMQTIQTGNVVSSILDQSKVASFMNDLSNSDLDTNSDNIATSDGLSDITKGARALIINFNREIVSMPISIDNVNDGTDLGSQLQGSLYDNIVRGLQIALNNSTGAM